MHKFKSICFQKASQRKIRQLSETERKILWYQTYLKVYKFVILLLKYRLAAVTINHGNLVRLQDFKEIKRIN